MGGRRKGEMEKGSRGDAKSPSLPFSPAPFLPCSPLLRTAGAAGGQGAIALPAPRFDDGRRAPLAGLETQHDVLAELGLAVGGSLHHRANDTYITHALERWITRSFQEPFNCDTARRKSYNGCVAYQGKVTFHYPGQELTLMIVAYSYARVSSAEQRKGRGLRRQLQDSASCAERNGWTLDTSLTFGESKSAFRSKNLKTGALGRFLLAIKEKRVKPGSVLIIESLDRLSRDSIDEADELFRSILKAGVDIQTLSPERHYTRESLKDVMARMEFLFIQARANEESEIKRHRSIRNWQLKRQDATKKVITRMIPHWLQVVEGQIVFQAEAVKIIRQMAQWAIDGLNVKKIAARMNASGLPIFTKAFNRRQEDETTVLYKKPLWDGCYILTTLRSRALIGEFVPHLRTETGREALEPIPNYYPSVLGLDVFNRLQIALDSRRRIRGRNGEKVNNLFKGLLHDAEGGTCYHNAKGKQSYLVSRNGFFGKGTYRTIRYAPFERAFRQFITEVQLQESPAVDAIPVLEAAIADLDKNIAATTKASEQHPKFSSLLETLVKLEIQRAELLDQLERERNSVPSAASLIEAKQLVTTSEDTDCRRKLRQRIAELIDSIWLKLDNNRGHGRARIVHCHCQVFFKDGAKREFWITTRRVAQTLPSRILVRPTYDLRQYDPTAYARHYRRGYHFSSTKIHCPLSGSDDLQVCPVATEPNLAIDNVTATVGF